MAETIRQSFSFCLKLRVSWVLKASSSYLLLGPVVLLLEGLVSLQQGGPDFWWRQTGETTM